jgi:hypothetical protein
MVSGTLPHEDRLSGRLLPPEPSPSALAIMFRKGPHAGACRRG